MNSSEAPQRSAPVNSITSDTAQDAIDQVDSAKKYPDQASLDGISDSGGDSNSKRFFDDACRNCGEKTYPSGCPICGGTCGMMTPNRVDEYFARKPDAPLVKKIKPLLEPFTLFPKLPKEIRIMIWEHTLEPRFVEVGYSAIRGFFSRTEIPIAMKACSESRQAVLKSYPLSFGNILQKPATRFNFSLDILYFEPNIQPRVTQFLVSLTRSEAESIQTIAIDRAIDYLFEEGHQEAGPDSAFDILRAANRAMPALKEVLVIFNLVDSYYMDLPCGIGQPIFSKKFPYELQMHVWTVGFDDKDFDSFYKCQEFSDEQFLTAGFDVPKTGFIFGWQPIELSIEGPLSWLI